MRIDETRLHQFRISNITRKAKTSAESIPHPKLISAILSKKNKYLELLFEVESFTGENKHVTLQGKESPIHSGYACILRFDNVDPETDLSNQDAVLDLVTGLDVKVHCDCPAFYWQGMYESDDLEDNTRYKFSSTRGTGEWDLRHASEDGDPGKALCKHLSVIQDWILDDWNSFWTQFSSKKRITESFQSPYEYYD